MNILLFSAILLLTFALTAIILRYLIPVLKSHKMGQKILDIGPRWHKSKEGTPTMGGVSFVIASLVVFPAFFIPLAVMGKINNPTALFLTFGMALLNGMIGCIDDYTKFIKKQNEGLLAWQKYLLQFVVSAAYLVSMKLWGGLTTSLYLPYLNKYVDFGFAYYIVAVLLLTGITNSVNLADGIDGLASSETVIVGAFFAAAGKVSVLPMVSGTAISFYSALLIGCALGFLVYNFHPAKVFMGDTGSLFLGGTVAGLAFLLNNPLIVLVAGFIYVIESISVMLQVFWCKVFGHRLFKMSPIHHHFEKCGWGEIKIVTVFCIAALLFCILAYFGLRTDSFISF